MVRIWMRLRSTLQLLSFTSLFTIHYRSLSLSPATEIIISHSENENERTKCLRFRLFKFSFSQSTASTTAKSENSDSLKPHAELEAHTVHFKFEETDAEEAFKRMVEIDRLIDMLREASPRELQKLVVENILAFNPGFWIRLAARSDTCKSEDDKKDYEELAVTVMNVVDLVVHKTKEKIESATDVLKGVLKPVVGDGEIHWPPRDPQALTLMEKEINKREQEGQLDEGFLAEVSAQLRQAKEDGDKPGLEAMLQKVLQFYASNSLSKRTYAMKGEEVLKDEQFLETIIQAPEEQWNTILIKGLTVGGGDVSPEELYAVVKKRVERTLIRTEGGSYQQRILTEYLKGIETRAYEIVQVLQGKPQ